MIYFLLAVGAYVVRGHVQTIIGKINVIVTLRAGPPPPPHS